MKHYNVYRIFTINTINLIMSAALFVLGIVMITYGFLLPSDKCDTEQYYANQNSDNQQDCLFVESNHIIHSNTEKGRKTQKMTDDAQALKILALVTGFILIVPITLNIIESILVKNDYDKKIIENITESISFMSPPKI